MGAVELFLPILRAGCCYLPIDPALYPMNGPPILHLLRSGAVEDNLTQPWLERSCLGQMARKLFH